MLISEILIAVMYFRNMYMYMYVCDCVCTCMCTCNDKESLEMLNVIYTLLNGTFLFHFITIAKFKLVLNSETFMNRYDISVCY